MIDEHLQSMQGASSYMPIIMLVILLIFAFVFRKNIKAILSQKQEVDKKISKIFYILIVAVPLVLVFLYYQKTSSSTGFTPQNKQSQSGNEIRI